MSRLMVDVAKSCAGLMPGKNFSAPNQMKIIPMLHRSSLIPVLAISRVMIVSIQRKFRMMVFYVQIRFRKQPGDILRSSFII